MRAARIRAMLEAKPVFQPPKLKGEGVSCGGPGDDFSAMQQDTMSLRARRCLPHLLRVIKPRNEPRIQEAVKHLEAWDCRMEVNRVGATIFEHFFARWVKAVVKARFPAEMAALMAGGANGLEGWFQPGQRDEAILATFEASLKSLEDRLGSNMALWAWGRIHLLPLRHYLSGRGELCQLLDHGGAPVGGNAHTVFNTGLGGHFEARSGPGYRLIADLSTTPPSLWAVDGQSESGHPGSPHYRDQLADWQQGRFHALPLDPTEVAKAAVSVRVLEPSS
jgi:penicillin amidase